MAPPSNVQSIPREQASVSVGEAQLEFSWTMTCKQRALHAPSFYEPALVDEFTGNRSDARRKGLDLVRQLSGALLAHFCALGRCSDFMVAADRVGRFEFCWCVGNAFVVVVPPE